MSGSRFDIGDLLGKLTLEEKASLCSGHDFWTTQEISAHGIPSVMVIDGPHGLRKVEGSPEGFGLSASVPATCFPTASALASTWDPALLERIGAALGAECRQEGVAVLLGPGVNMKRSPLCGRNFEYFAEDPVLAGVLGAALVSGVQSQGVGTSVKHFAANNQETDRMRVSADVDERTLREIYLPAFERIVTLSAPWTVMCAYNRLNGVYTSEDPWLLTSVLREEWGFDGLVMSDWGAVSDRVASLAAGLDLEMPGPGGDARLVAAVRSGALSEKVLDSAVLRILGLLDRVLPGLDDGGSYDAAVHHSLARSAAGQAVVLLKNESLADDSPALPLDRAALRSLACIGAFFAAPRYQGAGSSRVNPTRLDIPLDEIRALAGSVDVRYAAGFSLSDDVVDPELMAEAAATASGSDRTVVFLGLPPRAESEGYDRAGIGLPANQLALLDAVLATGSEVVVLLANGSVVSLEPWHDSAVAILECWLAGQGAGGAVADVLFGEVNPSGKLAETMPLAESDGPAYLNFPGERGHVRYGEGVFVGYRGYDKLGTEVRYPFGHGLSYTTFGYSDLDVTVLDAAVLDAAVLDAVDGLDTAAGLVRVRATITNTGPVPGAEVVQVYVGDPVASVPRPPRELKAFAKVALLPGESQTLQWELTTRDFSYFDVALGAWKLEGGEFTIDVAASSRDLRLSATITLPDDGQCRKLDAGSTLSEWLAHPVGGPLLTKRVLEPLLNAAGGAGVAVADGTGAADGSSGAGQIDGTMLQMASSIPLIRLGRFPGLPLTPEFLEELLAEANA
jgi:beta-glucosidase